MTENLHKSKPAKLNEVSKKAPEVENKITFNDFDKLNLKSFGEDVIRVIENDKSLSSDQKSCTISLNADFGQGKTTFLEMLKSFIEDKNADKYTVLFIDAWRGDFFKEPIITILSEFLEYLEKNKKVKGKKNILKIIGKVGGNLTNQLLKKHTGIDSKKVKKEIKEEELGQNLFKEFKQRKQVLKEVKNVISNYTKDDKKLVIIVDELDRARPDYAVHFLEDMKHFFDIENVVFIFGINKTQMEATVKTLYGQQLKFEGYYRKFFKHEIDLPDPYQETINFIESLLKQTKTHEKLNSINIHFLFKTFKLTLRDLLRFIELCDVILSKTTEDDERNYKYNNSVLFFICLYIKKKDIFQKVLNNEFKLGDFLKFIGEEKIPYDNDEEKNFLTQVAFSFLKKGVNGQYIAISHKRKQEFEKFEADRAKIAAKFGNDSVSITSSYLFDHKPDSHIIRKEPCLIICDTIQHQEPFYKNKSGF